jgi:hypothetical protein
MKQMQTSGPLGSKARSAALYASLAAIACATAVTPLHAQANPGQDPNSPRPGFPRGLRPPDEMHNGPRPDNPPSTLPPTPPTSAPPATPAANTLIGPMAATPLNAAGTTSTRPHRAEVTFANGQLNVRANDSSLNQILRAISRETGLTITGGVQDQRVFGQYGPASTSAVLATLLDGTGTNILLREGDSTRPPELVLTPRGGGPTPPSPSAVPDDSIADAPPAQSTPAPAAVATTPATTVVQPAVQPATTATTPTRSVVPGGPIPPNNVLGSQYNTTPTASEVPSVQSVPLDSLPSPTTAQGGGGIVDSPNPPSGATPAPGTATPGALTPEAVYQQLLLMQQKQAQPATTTPPPQ